MKSITVELNIFELELLTLALKAATEQFNSFGDMKLLLAKINKIEADLAFNEQS